MVTRILDRLMWLFEYALACAFIAAVLLNFINVVGRYVFGVTFLGSDEMQIFIMIFMTFLGAAVVAWANQHLRMDVLVNMLPPSLARALRIVELVVVATLCTFVAWNSTYYAEQMFSIGRISDMARVPMWIPHGAVALGFGLMALITVLQLIETVTPRAAVDRKSSRGF
jgi:TRAP-type C4-dicarboxylate transport system permease small subunit